MQLMCSVVIQFQTMTSQFIDELMFDGDIFRQPEAI